MSEMKELKDDASLIPEIMPKKKVVTVKVSKPLSKKEQERERERLERETAEAELLQVQDTLETEENDAFGSSPGAVRRRKYAALSRSDKKKRVDEAVKRRKNAREVVAAEMRMGKKPHEIAEIDEKTFKDYLSRFMKLSDEPYKMDTDESFVKNLEANYELCIRAADMKKWVKDAVDHGYFPKKTDLAEVEAKISRFLDLKEYLDAQKALMKSPYYQYIAKKDLSYTDEQMDMLINSTQKQELTEYLINFRTLKNLPYVRKKGMDSVKKRSLAFGKREALILKTRAEKRQLIRTFSEEALTIRGNRRFRDKNYDRNYTPRRFRAALESFRKLKVSDLHFKSLRDIADHFRENVSIFEETREFEHLLFMAVQKGLTPNDNDIIEIRSKIKAFKNAEYMMNDIQKEVLTNGASFIKDKTFEEFLAERLNSVKQSISPEEGFDVPLPGTDMDSYYRGILKKLKSEHRNRRKAVKAAYGLTHPKEYGQEDRGREGYGLGEIPAEELEKRVRDYEKNVFINDYIGDLAIYREKGYGDRLKSFAAVYESGCNELYDRG